MDALSFFANVDWAEIWLATIDTMIMLFGSLFFTVNDCFDRGAPDADKASPPVTDNINPSDA